MIRRSLLILLGLAVPAAAADKRPFAIPDLYRLKGVEEPAIAPDGRSVVYKLTSSDLMAVKRWSNLWRVSPDGTEGYALTFEDKLDSSPAFSADGKTLTVENEIAGGGQTAGKKTEVWIRK